MKNVKFGLLNYSTANLGDEIQSIAVRQFLPRVDFWADRENLDKCIADPSDENRIVVNGWFMHSPEYWPPHSSLKPLFISFHLSGFSSTYGPRGGKGSGLIPSEVLFEGKNLEYLKNAGPIGARDLHTLNLLRKHGVNSYFSGCMTLTLPERDSNQVEDIITVVDLDEAVVNHIQSKNRSKLQVATQMEFKTLESLDRFKLAEERLASYARSKCVVTSRLHVALPCLAMKVPVLLINTSPDQSRFLGLHSFLRNGTQEEFFEGKLEFNFDNPTPNSDSYLQYRKSLIQAVKDFVQL